MKRTRALYVALAVSLMSALAGPAAAQTPLNSRYSAENGFLPDQPQWTLVGATGASSIADGKLIISTASNSQNQFYVQTSSVFANPLPDPLIVEARVRLISGSASQLDRAPISVAITTAPNVGVVFFVDAGRIFLTAGQAAGGSVIGSTAFVPTDDALHTYRIAIHGGAVDVSYDGVPTLSGSTYVGPDDHGAVPRILWGEGSSVAHGTSEWAFFKHNAGRGNGCAAETADLQAELDAANGQIADLSAQIADLTSRNTSLQGALNTANAALDAANARISDLETALGAAHAAADAANARLAEATALVANQLATLLNDLRSTFRNPAFVLPGATPFEQLQNLVNAIKQLNRGRKEGLYVTLGGRP